MEIIAVVAIVISAFSLGWNVYRDVVLKARIKIKFSLSDLLHPTFHKPIIYLVLSAINIGPGKVKVCIIQIRKAQFWRRLLRKTEHAILIHDYENPISSKIPADLDVGESVDLLIRYEQDCFLEKDFTHIGISDSFGRVHWASHSDVKKAKKQYLERFGKKESK